MLKAVEFFISNKKKIKLEFGFDPISNLKKHILKKVKRNEKDPKNC